MIKKTLLDKNINKIQHVFMTDGASQVLEELEEFYYDTVNDKRLNERTRESLEQFFDYQLADIKDKAMDIQDETQSAIDSFVEEFNINENE